MNWLMKCPQWLFWLVLSPVIAGWLWLCWTLWGVFIRHFSC